MSKIIITDMHDEKFLSILESFSVYDLNIEHQQKVMEAYKLAKERHKNQFRKSGEAYIIHPLAVAKMAADYQMDWVTICTCLLHDIVEDTKYPLALIEKQFGTDVMHNVDGVTKITRMDFSYDVTKEELLASNVRKLFRVMIYQDIRTIIVKLLDRVHNIRTLQYMRQEKQIEKASETLEVYAPIAEFIGANEIKKELQDLSFSYLEPEKCQEIELRVSRFIDENRNMYEQLQQKLADRLNQDNLENKINLRVKNLYNIYISLCKRNADLRDIHDLVALQIVLKDARSCFNGLYTIHSSGYEYLQDKFKDYINKCKTTGYKALHTTLVTPNDGVSGKSVMVQVQIRDQQMALQNTRGIMGSITNYDKDQFENVKKQYPFIGMFEAIDKQAKNDLDFYEAMKKEVLGNKIFVTSAVGGKCCELPVGATVLDFAFLECINRAPFATNGKVNGQIVPLDYVLKNNDLVTFDSTQRLTVNEESLNMCTTTIARRRILERL